MLRRTILVVFASTAALAVAVSAGGAPTRAAASPFIGTWKILPAAGTPWANGGTLTIRASTRAEVAGYAIAPPVGRFSQMHGRCLGFDPPSPAEPDYVPPAVTGWFVATASWDSQTMAGCYSDKTTGRLALWTTNEAATGEAFFTSEQKLMGRWKGPGFEAKAAEEGTTKTVNEPAPGTSTFIGSPTLPAAGVDCGTSPGRAQSVAAKPQTCSIKISSSENDLTKTVVAGEGTVEREAGQFLFFCWANLLQKATPAQAITGCLHLLIGLIKDGQFQVSKPALSMRGPSVARAPRASAATGCRSTPIAITVRKRKGKFVVIGRNRHAKPRASSVRYSCSGSGSAATIKIIAPGGIRNALGKRLTLGVYRAKNAPRRSAKLSFTFGWK